MEGSHCNTHLPFLCQSAETPLQLSRFKTRLEWPDEKHHGELRMDDRLLNIHDVQILLKKELGHFRDNSDLIVSYHRDDIEIPSPQWRTVVPFDEFRPCWIHKL